MPKKELTISLPFSINAYGRVGTTQEQSKIWQDRVRSVIGTYLGERVLRPGFGSNVSEEVFESEEDAQITIRQAIQQSFSTWLPTLSLKDTLVDYDENTGILEVEVIYALPDSVTEEVESTTIGVVRIAGNLPPIQEIL